MLESKHLPREITLPGKNHLNLANKGRRQTNFRAVAGRGGPGNWVGWKEVESTDKPVEVFVSVVSEPVIAKDVIVGEFQYPDANGNIVTGNIFPWGPGFAVQMGIPKGRRIGRIMMRFKNTSIIFPASRSLIVNVKVITAKR